MSTPAAKRRRVDAANAALRKPFQSPVIRRPDTAQGAPGPSKTPDAAKKPAEEAYSPSSPSVSAGPRTGRPVGSLGAILRQTPHRPPPAPSRFKTPLHPSATTSSSAVKRRRSALEASADGDEKGENPGGVFLALVRAHRHTSQDAVVRDLDRRLEAVRQARRIEEASERQRPGEPIDQELRDLVGRWKGAGRMAAEELFEAVKERVDNAGGPKAWKEMRQRQLEFYQELDQESPSRSKNCDDAGLEEELEGACEEESALEAAQARQTADENAQEEDSEPEEFNMAQMLRSLNIDLELLGYDETDEKWTD